MARPYGTRARWNWCVWGVPGGGVRERLELRARRDVWAWGAALQNARSRRALRACLNWRARLNFCVRRRQIL